MTKYKLSPWHDGSIKPVHVGVYEVFGEGGGGAFQYWNGKWWGLFSLSQRVAFSNRSSKSYYQNESWRGILKD